MCDRFILFSADSLCMIACGLFLFLLEGERGMDRSLEMFACNYDLPIAAVLLPVVITLFALFCFSILCSLLFSGFGC